MSETTALVGVNAAVTLLTTLAAIRSHQLAVRRCKIAAILLKRKGYIGMKREDIDKFTGRKVIVRFLTENYPAQGTLTQVTDSTAIVLDKKGKQKVVALDFIVSIDVED
jgi:hypothetical protein